MYYVLVQQDTGRAKLPAFFQRFSTEESVLIPNKARVLVKTLLIQITLALDVKVNQMMKTNSVLSVFADLRPVLYPLNRKIRICTFFKHYYVV